MLSISVTMRLYATAWLHKRMSALLRSILNAAAHRYPICSDWLYAEFSACGGMSRSIKVWNNLLMLTILITMRSYARAWLHMRMCALLRSVLNASAHRYPICSDWLYAEFSACGGLSLSIKEGLKQSADADDINYYAIVCKSLNILEDVLAITFKIECWCSSTFLSF